MEWWCVSLSMNGSQSEREIGFRVLLFAKERIELGHVGLILTKIFYLPGPMSDL